MCWVHVVVCVNYSTKILVQQQPHWIYMCVRGRKPIKPTMRRRLLLKCDSGDDFDYGLFDTILLSPYFPLLYRARCSQSELHKPAQQISYFPPPAQSLYTNAKSHIHLTDITYNERTPKVLGAKLHVVCFQCGRLTFLLRHQWLDGVYPRAQEHPAQQQQDIIVAPQSRIYTISTDVIKLLSRCPIAKRKHERNEAIAILCVMMMGTRKAISVCIISHISHIGFNGRIRVSRRLPHVLFASEKRKRISHARVSRKLCVSN